MTMTFKGGVEVRNVSRIFQLQRPTPFSAAPKVTAVKSVSLAIPEGTTFGLVGESGSGKSTLARMLLKLDRPTSGEILIDGEDITRHTKEQAAVFRRRVAAVFQDPYSALSPRLRVDRFVGEPLEAQGVARADIRVRVAELFAQVGLPAGMMTRYPHEFSGGQRQRIAIARALSTEPSFLVLDEPVAALDVSISAQILQLLREMQQRLGLTYLFIGHDLTVVRYLSTTVGVMYFGRLVEVGPAAKVLGRPLHPYTRRLVDVAAGERPLGEASLGGELPNPLAPPSGCTFRTRCPFADARCAAEEPELRPDGDQRVACHHFERIRASEDTGHPIRLAASAP